MNYNEFECTVSHAQNRPQVKFTCTALISSLVEHCTAKSRVKLSTVQCSLFYSVVYHVLLHLLLKLMLIRINIISQVVAEVLHYSLVIRQQRPLVLHAEGQPTNRDT